MGRRQGAGAPSSRLAFHSAVFPLISGNRFRNRLERLFDATKVMRRSLVRFALAVGAIVTALVALGSTRGPLQQPLVVVPKTERDDHLPVQVPLPVVPRRINHYNYTSRPVSERCENDVFVVHWTHVPKAGGTAFASLAKKVACAKNPAFKKSNPCCVPNVCVADSAEINFEFLFFVGLHFYFLTWSVS